MTNSIIINKQVKNGDKKEILTYKIDTSKPKCWVEGNCYKFNSTLIKREVVDGIDEVLLIVNRRFRICRQPPICPKCRAKQIQLIDASLLAKWKCRECHYKWVYEPLVIADKKY